MKQQAEVAVYFGRYDEAEKLYRDIDRKDLAIGLRERQGDWFKVLQLVQTGGGDDELMVKATTKIGDYYAERFNWRKAVMMYQQVGGGGGQGGRQVERAQGDGAAHRARRPRD